MNKPELLAPAGDLEKLKTAVCFGADAVYVGGRRFGLRAKSKNLSGPELEEGVRFAHAHGRKVYVTANIFARDADFEGMAEFFCEMQNIGVDALIISDPGIFDLARETVPDMDIHISTQTGVMNARSAAFWRGLGAKRVVLARELSALEIKRIYETMPVDLQDFQLETFVHGAMCVSFSGRCLLSAYMANRDANRGECAQPCRWKYNVYALEEQSRPGEYMPLYENDEGTYILNSKDLCLIEHIPKIVATGVGSLKIEGRMKSAYYVAATVSAYRQAIDDYFTDPDVYESRKNEYLNALEKASHRHFTTGFFLDGECNHNDMQIYSSSAYERGYDFIGLVLGYDKDTKTVVLRQQNKFSVGDNVELLRSDGSVFHFTINCMTDEQGAPITVAPHPEQIVRVGLERYAEEFDILRKEVSK